MHGQNHIKFQNCNFHPRYKTRCHAQTSACPKNWLKHNVQYIKTYTKLLTFFTVSEYTDVDSHRPNHAF